MARPNTSSRSALATGVASCVMLVPTGCRRPTADVAVAVGPNAGERAANQGQPCTPCATPEPPPGSPDDHVAPQILAGRFITRDRIELSFSEPLAAVEGVNPRQFRLSRAYSMIDSSGDHDYASGTYYDVGGLDTYQAPLVVIELELLEDRPEVLMLSLNQPIPVEVCEDLADMRADADAYVNTPGERHQGQVGMFLHYTTRGSDGVRDRVNNPLADIGGDWALHFGTRQKQMYGTEPIMRLDLLVEIPCPDENLGQPGGSPGPT